MSAHVDEEVIAAVALGDHAVRDADVEHVHRCARCAALLAQFDQVQDLLRRQDVAEDQLPLDPQLWQQIAAATFGDAARTAGRPLARGAVSRRASVAPPRRHPVLLAVAALVCALAGLGIGRLLWGPQEPPARVLASTSLAAVDGSRTFGDAQLLDEAGQTELEVSATAAPAGSGFVEVWLLNEDGKRMVSLGVLDSSRAVFTVPPGAVNQGYRIVDLSRESYDGDAGHSGDSIMRGTLPA